MQNAVWFGRSTTSKQTVRLLIHSSQVRSLVGELNFRRGRSDVVPFLFSLSPRFYRPPVNGDCDPGQCRTRPCQQSITWSAARLYDLSQAREYVLARWISTEFLANNPGYAGFQTCSKMSGLQGIISPLAWVMM